ncbi:MAG: DUF3852 family protein [Oscillospiraceae bacterium]|nr:DUF3852 family protein [Oscillospiraceae bacterium]
MKRIKTKIASAVLAAYSLALSVGASSGISQGLNTAKNESQSAIKATVDTFVVPIGSGLAVVAFLIFLVIAGFKKHQGDDVRNTIMLAVVMLVLLALLQTWSSWGWALIGW